jgi:putative membrane protein
MMGFGFVVARFGLFLRELSAMPGKPPMPHSGFSLWIGTLLVLFGVIVNLGAAYKHYGTLHRLERGQPLVFKPWSLAIVVALLLGALGVLMATYLLFGLDH